jgi:GNAT superfamily N-acetyltransferase
MKPSHIFLTGLTLSAVSGYYLMQPTKIVHEQKELLRIEPLYGREQYFKSIMEMHHDEWKVGKLATLLENDQSKNNRLPYTVIAFYDEVLIGSCTLEESCTLDTTHSPWASHLYVTPKFRGRKIAKNLIIKILEVAKNLGFEQFFYVTNNPRTASIYVYLGGSLIYKTFYNGQECSIMEATIEIVRNKIEMNSLKNNGD